MSKTTLQLGEEESGISKLPFFFQANNYTVSSGETQGVNKKLLRSYYVPETELDLDTAIVLIELIGWAGGGGPRLENGHI